MSCWVEINNVWTNLLLRQVCGYPLHTRKSAVSKRHQKRLYSVSGKKETKMFLAISQTKLGRFSWNLIHDFLKKFAIKECKHFPPHLNNVSTLPCETWNAHRARATIGLLDTETPEFIPLQLWSPSLPDLNPVDNRVWKILQEGVQNVHHWSGAIHTPLTDGCHNDDVIQLVPLRSQSLFQFV